MGRESIDPPPGYGVDYQVFVGQAVTSGTPLELALRKVDGVKKMVISEISIYINDYALATGVADGAVTEVHWSDTLAHVDSGTASATRIGEFVYEAQNLLVFPLYTEINDSILNLWIKTNYTGTYQVNVKYFFEE